MAINVSADPKRIAARRAETERFRRRGSLAADTDGRAMSPRRDADGRGGPGMRRPDEDEVRRPLR